MLDITIGRAKLTSGIAMISMPLGYRVTPLDLQLPGTDHLEWSDRLMANCCTCVGATAHGKD